MRQAIVTKYLGPTNHRGARVKASCHSTSRVYPWEDALDANDNHTAAARALAQALGWLGQGWTLAGGAMPDGSGNCYVFVQGDDK